MDWRAFFWRMAVVWAGIVAGLTVLFWFRELDLSFLASFREVILTLVIFAAAILGMQLGLVITPQPIGANTWQLLHTPVVRIILAIGVIGILINWPGLIIEKIRLFWALSAQNPLPLTALTRTLLEVLINTFHPVFLVILVIRGYILPRAKDTTEPSDLAETPS